MKDKILKLCRRLKECTLDDLISLTEEKEYIIKSTLTYLENCGCIKTDNFINYKHKLKQKVIFGHTPFEKPYIEDDKIGINTGSGIDESGYITAYITNTNEFIFSK